MKKSLLTLLALLCVVVQGSWAQEPTPSTALEPYITTLGGTPTMAQHKLDNYFEQSFLDTGVMDWLNSKKVVIK